LLESEGETLLLP
jgi:hypothetical protein